MDLTRRALIRRAAAATGALAAGSLVAPRIVFAGEAGEAVFEMRLPRSRAAGSGGAAAGGAAAGSGRVAAGSDHARWHSGLVVPKRPFELIGIATTASAEVRARGLDGRWSEWLPFHAGHEGTELSDPVWVGPADAFEVRSHQAVGGARVLLVDPGHGASASAVRHVDAGMDAGPGQPQIVARSSWANASCRPRISPIFGAVQLAFVHHTVSSNGYRRSQSAAMVRSICLFHKYGNGWNDIGYNFVVDRFGQIFEGRLGGIDETIVGAQAGGYNVYSSGVALLGDFGGSGPSRKTFDALAQLLAWKLTLHGVDIPGTTTVTVTTTGAPYSRFRAGARVQLNRISGHRDADSTACPGSGMYRQLPRLRQVVARLAGTPSALDMQVTGTAPGSVALAGTLTAAGTPIGGATIEVQSRSVRRSATTIATAVTNPDGTWSVAAPLPAAANMRALFRGDADHSAIVSPGLDATTPPALTLTAATQQAAPGAVIAFSGTSVPAKPKIAIVISQEQPDGSFTPVRTIRLNAADNDGSFARSIGFLDPGQYQVIAHTSADKSNALGTSAPVGIAIG
jgi:hypothetical protein